MSFDKKIQQLNNNEEYTYADINETLDINKQQFIYDKTFNKFIKSSDFWTVINQVVKFKNNLVCRYIPRGF